MKRNPSSLRALAIFLALVGLSLAAAPAVADGGKYASLSGKYMGTYYYPENQNPPVNFMMILVFTNQGQVFGMMRETKTFGEGSGPYLYAEIEGKISSTGELKFTKTYDGTGKATHSVKYEGKMDLREAAASGIWYIPESWKGRFEINKAR